MSHKSANYALCKLWTFNDFLKIISHVQNFDIWTCGQSDLYYPLVADKNALIGPGNWFWPISSKCIWGSQHFHRQSVSHRPSDKPRYRSVFTAKKGVTPPPLRCFLYLTLISKGSHSFYYHRRSFRLFVGQEFVVWPRPKY